MKSKSEKIVDALNDRKGFDHWWYNIDSETQEEILEELEKIINKKD